MSSSDREFFRVDAPKLLVAGSNNGGLHSIYRICNLGPGDLKVTRTNATVRDLKLSETLDVNLAITDELGVQPIQAPPSVSGWYQRLA